jgi:replicative DNA helicase
MVNAQSELLKATILAEENLLGALMLATVVLGDEFALPEVKKLVSYTDFQDYHFKGDRARIYCAMCQCEHPDITTVTHELMLADCLDVNDISYLRQLLLGAPTSYNYMEYARIVKDYSIKRGGGGKKYGVSLRVRT